MLIDWFTVAAQIVNFLVLIWLLKRFLYPRILGAIEAREKRIASRLADAAAKEQQASEQLALYNARLRDLEQQQQTMLADAKVAVAARQSEMTENARHEIELLKTKWTEELDRERDAFLLELRRRAAAEILEITRRTVEELAGIDVQECAVRVFLEQIQSMDVNAGKMLANGELLVRSEFDVPPQARERIERALEDKLQLPVRLKFIRTRGIGLGLEIRGGGWRLGWNSESYLEALEDHLKQAIESSPEARKVQAGVS